jgi:signal transduction histidine kinase/ActR/RegA family two-component response regulator
MLGKPESEVAGRTAADAGIPAERRRSFIELLLEARRGGRPLIVERPGLSRGSAIPSIQWMSVVVSPLADQRGRIPRFVLIATDVTHQRNLEAELQRAQKLEAVGRLAGGIAHDFNNLLTAITGFTRFALTDLPEDSPVRPDLEQALLAAERAGALTHQLLAFSRQQVLQPQVLNLNEVVENVEPMLRRVIGEDIRIHLALSDALGSVRADRGQLEQVLVNLVVNARDAMPQGGVLTIETSDVELDAGPAAASQTGAPGPHVMLAVTDTGVGMSAATRDRIFEPFFTTKETGHGTGLGLATVFGIVRQSGGSIWVYSEPGQGSTFKIYLPRYDGPAEVARTPTPVSVPTVSGRVLLVEDDPAVRSIAARVLRSAGYDVVEATTGREGLTVYASLGGRVDLVLTDLVLPELGGRAMVASLIANGMTTPVVYMSGYTAEAMSAQSVLEPGDLFVEKPFTPESLLSKVREAMQNGRQERRAG